MDLKIASKATLTTMTWSQAHCFLLWIIVTLYLKQFYYTVFVHMCAFYLTYVEVKEQPLGVGTYLLPCCGSVSCFCHCILQAVWLMTLLPVLLSLFLPHLSV